MEFGREPCQRLPEVDEVAAATSLKDLLAQVAPQARIVENNSRITSRSSARIQAGLARVFTESKDPAAWYEDGDRDAPEVYGALEPTPAPRCGGGPPTSSSAAGSTTTGGSSAASSRIVSGAVPFSRGMRSCDDDDEAPEFLERWESMFSKESQLAADDDPFKYLEHRRRKVVWKKSSERPGHHSRYQKRRQQREGEMLRALEAKTAEGEAQGVSLVFDASNVPQSL